MIDIESVIHRGLYPSLVERSCSIEYDVAVSQRLHRLMNRYVLVKPDYHFVASIHDNPFTIDHYQARIASDMRLCKSLSARCKGIYDVIEQRTQYQLSSSYKHAREVIQNKQGVCGEMAFVIINITRMSGLTSNYLCVDIDHRGESVHHACAAVFAPELRQVDVAYHQHNAHHQSTCIIDDDQTVMRYKQWR